MFGSLFEISNDNGDNLINSLNILSASSFLLTVLMVGAIFVRINIKDKLVNVLPATFYAILNVVILYYSLF